MTPTTAAVMPVSGAVNFRLPCVVSINNFTFDTPAEIELLKKKNQNQAMMILSRLDEDNGL